MATVNLTQERLLTVLDYDPETGVFTYKRRLMSKKRPTSRGGRLAGTLKEDSGYVIIGVDRHLYRAHRLAWLYIKGVWPNGHIDHIDGNRSNNRFNNLREATKSQNGQNQRRPKSHNKSGFLGVSFNKQNKTHPWVAFIKANGKSTYVGSFGTPEEAHRAYVSAKRRLHEYCSI